MSGENTLDDIALEELLRELKTRENPELKKAPRDSGASSPLANFDTEQIVENVITRQKVIYGVDNRQDVFSVTNQNILDSADAVVSLWPASAVADNGNGTSTLNTENFGTARNLCASEPFRSQPIGAFCSGFLVAPDIVATAGHCVNASNVTNTRFVFGYRMSNASNAQTVINNSEIYQGVSIIDRHLSGTNSADWALVRLDRSVTNHQIVFMRRTGTINNNQAVYVIGHPVGLPIKYAPGANVRDNTPAEFFVANLDTYGGNSGSPVFNANSHQVEGILVRGETDFVMNGTCQVSLVCPNTGCRGEECTKTTGFDHLVPNFLQGSYTIQQVSNSRFLDAHENAANDFSVVTRTAQNNNTQRWKLTPIQSVYTIRQVSSNRFLDAHQDAANDFSVVTRTAQNDDTQRWVLLYLGNNRYSVRQMSNGRFLDAHENSANDFNVVTRGAQNNNTQRWTLTPLGDNRYTIQQVSNNRFLDAHEVPANDFSVVTRTAQNNDTQRWTLSPVGGVYTIQQVSGNRFLDAHQDAANDFSVVTQTAQNDDTQRWVLMPLGNNRYTVQQLNNGRFLDAHEDAANNFSVVTRTVQTNDTQRWLFTSPGPPASGPPASGLQVSNVSLRPPAWIPPADYTYKVTVVFNFNRSVKQPTLKSPGTVKIDLTGTHDGRTVSGITGTFRFSGPPDTASEAVFISDKTGSELINPQAGENIKYTITLFGTDAGAGVVTDSSGEALDGDADGKPGGNFVKVIEVVG